MAQPSEFPGDEPRIVDESPTWLESNVRTVFGILALVLLLCVAGVWWWQGRQERASQASALLVKAAGADDWKKIADDYAGTPAAPLALMRLADAARETSDWEGSLVHLDRFTREYRRHPFLPAVQLSRAQTLEASGKVEEALQAYQAMHNAKPAHLYSGAAVLGLSRIHQTKGNLALARSVLSDFLATEKSSVFTSEVSQALKALPEAPAPAPVPVP